MLILSLRTCPHRPRSIHIHKPALQCCGGGPQGPVPPRSKATLYSWERERGKLEMGSAPPWAHFLTISCTSPSHPHHIARCLPPLPPSLPTSAPPARPATSPPPLHVSRCAPASRPPWSRPPRLGSSGKVPPAPSRRRRAHPYHTPPARRTRPTLSCDGGRPSHGRATLLLSGRPEAYDKFRWRAGSGRGSLAAVLCVVGPQGRQTAPLHTHLARLLPARAAASPSTYRFVLRARRLVGGARGHC